MKEPPAQEIRDVAQKAGDDLERTGRIEAQHETQIIGGEQWVLPDIR